VKHRRVVAHQCLRRLFGFGFEDHDAEGSIICAERSCGNEHRTLAGELHQILEVLRHDQRFVLGGARHEHRDSCRLNAIDELGH
jgi:hypothetical protein